MKISILTPTIRGNEALKPIEQSLARQTLRDFEWLVEQSDGREHDLNAAFNRMLRKAKGDLIVFYEDYQKIKDDGLEQFWNAWISHNPNNFYTAPVAKTLDWKEVKYDWRKETTGELPFHKWEIDWACAPRSALVELGGFDEELDKYWSCDNVNLAFRAALKGHRFYNLIDNEAIVYDHNKVIEHPFIKNYNPEFNNERMKLFEQGLELTL